MSMLWTSFTLLITDGDLHFSNGERVVVYDGEIAALA